MQPGQRPRRGFDARGQAKGERLSEYFDFRSDPEKRVKKVTREELLALLTRKWLVEREMRWYIRLWRFLQARMGTAPKPIGGGVLDDAEVGEAQK